MTVLDSLLSLYVFMMDKQSENVLTNRSCIKYLNVGTEDTRVLRGHKYNKIVVVDISFFVVVVVILFGFNIQKIVCVVCLVLDIAWIKKMSLFDQRVTRRWRYRTIYS